MNKILKKIFNKKSNKTESNQRNPWRGLASYEDPITEESPSLFCGRSVESNDVFDLIDNNLLVTIYGKSGIGKTSLLKAGVFPLLRAKNYFPIYIRLKTSGKTEHISKEICENIGSSLQAAFGEESVKTIEVIPECNKSEEETYLWSYFARHKFYNSENKVIFPVIVFDQFEEVIRSSRLQVIDLLKQISYLIDKNNAIKDCKVNDLDYVYDYNFRFVISIREDDLYRLEDLINLHYLSSLKPCRYRLQNLLNESAEEVITINGKNCIDSENLNEIVAKLIEVSSQNETGLISTNVLSLVCARLFEIVTQKGKDLITLGDVNEYLKNNPFEEYYSKAVHKLSEREKRFIEEQLVTTDGRRARISEARLAQSIKSYKKLLQGDTIILRYIKSEDENYIELIHDGICPIVLNNRTERLEKKNRTIYRLDLFIIGILSVWILNKSVVNDFVLLFLKIVNGSIHNIDFIEAIAILQLLNIICFPIAVGTIVFDLSYKKIIAWTIGIIYVLPLMFYPHFIFISLKNKVSIILKIFTENIELINLFSDRTEVFIVYSIIVWILCVTNLFSKKGVSGPNNSLSFLVTNRGLLIFYWIIASFLFYKSIFNTGNFIIEASDSSWGLLLIPVLTLCIIGFKHNYSINKRGLIIYIILLFFLFVTSLLEYYLPFYSYIIICMCALISSLMLYYTGNIFSSIGKACVNLLVLTIVILCNMGYNPLVIKSVAINKVYPWKIIVFKDQDKLGLLDAKFGDTLLVPEFRNNYEMFYTRTIPKNGYIDSIRNNIASIASSPIAFPFNVNKNENGEWTLSVQSVPNCSNTIADMSHKKISANHKLYTEKFGASLFFKLRNSICKFCLTGDESILLKDLNTISQYEEIIQKELDYSLATMSKNDSIMTEKNIVPFIKALSRCMLMNMLKEALLRSHYTNYISGYRNFYLTTMLTDIVANTGFHQEFEINNNWDIALSTIDSKNTIVSNQFSSKNKVKLYVSLDELNKGVIYAWNNLLVSFFFSEYSTYFHKWYSKFQLRLQTQEDIVSEFVDYLAYFIEELQKVDKELRIRGNDMKEILSRLNTLKENGEEVDALELKEILQKTLSNVKYSDELNNKIANNMDSYMSISQQADELLEKWKVIELRQADYQFKEITSTTLNSLLKLIERNPFNPYNGFLISICENLYVLGKVRGYDMYSYYLTLNSLENYGESVFYKFDKEVESMGKEHECMIDSLEKFIDISNLKIKEFIETQER